ncbi:MAG TPA: hypothetical protein VFU22_18915 [Roseiflexaceae bacterium]|nr:hypothetical protein [Roseiflexaceae bacterium]
MSVLLALALLMAGATSMLPQMLTIGGLQVTLVLIPQQGLLDGLVTAQPQPTVPKRRLANAQHSMGQDCMKRV